MRGEIYNNIKVLDRSVRRASDFHPQGCEFKPHWGQNFIFLIICNKQILKLSKRFPILFMEKILPKY